MRQPKAKAIISEVDGKVQDIIKKGEQIIVQIKPIEEMKEKSAKGGSASDGKILEYTLPDGMSIRLKKGDLISAGQQISEGSIDLKDLFATAGKEIVQRYIIKEVQKIYTFAGENINDRHIEMIIRQMFSRLENKRTWHNQICN